MSIQIDEKGVFIDGKQYILRETIISEDAIAKLSKAYGIAWANGKYDPYHDCPSTDKLANISDLLSDVNKELHFKK